MSKELDTLKAEFNKQYKLSKIDINTVTDRQLRLTTEGTINAAKQKLATLKPQLIQFMMNQSTTVFVASTVDVSAPLEDLKEKVDNVVILDFLGMDKVLLNRAYPEGKIKGFPFNVATIDRINNGLYEMRNFVKADYIPPVAISGANYRVLQNREEALDVIQSLLFKTFNNELKSLYLGKEMNDALELKMPYVDSLVFFIVNTNGNLKGLEGMTGKTVVINEVENVPTTAEQLQKLVAKKLKEQKTNNKETL